MIAWALSLSPRDAPKRLIKTEPNRLVAFENNKDPKTSSKWLRNEHVANGKLNEWNLQNFVFLLPTYTTMM